MPIEHAFSYMVHPRKGDPDASKINGSAVDLQGKMYDLLKEVYDKSDSECNIDIRFNKATDGSQSNPCLNIVRTFASTPTVGNGREIALRLSNSTDGRSGPGLMFLILGKEGDAHKLLISRFPADSGILAEENQSELKLDFLERIFLKSAHSYKAALFKHVSIDSGFWNARAVDKQSNSVVLASDYWVTTFLDSDFATTSAAGTLRLANALKEAVKKVADPDIISELVATGTLLKNAGGKKLSIDELQTSYGLSDAAFNAIVSNLKNPETSKEKFVFNYGEFVEHIPYRSIVLDSGVTITAPFDKFGSVVKQTKGDGLVSTFSVQGRVIDQKLQKLAR